MLLQIKKVDFICEESADTKKPSAPICEEYENAEKPKKSVLLSEVNGKEKFRTKSIEGWL